MCIINKNNQSLCDFCFMDLVCSKHKVTIINEEHRIFYDLIGEENLKKKKQSVNLWLPFLVHILW